MESRSPSDGRDMSDGGDWSTEQLAEFLAGIQGLRAERERWTLLTRLALIQRSIAHHAPLQEVLDAISGGASQLLDERIAGVALIDPGDPDQIVTHSIVGLDSVDRQRLRRMPMGSNPFRRAIAEGSVIAIEHFQSAPGMHPYLLQAGIEAAIAAPVSEESEVVGALVVASRTVGRRFNEPEREVLTAFAEYASLALTDARLTDQVERALHDPLTGLPNRSSLSERLTERLAAGRSEPAVISLDLDRFRAVNDRIGHRAGDRLLIELARRLSDQASPDTVVARLESDTFALLTSKAGVHALAGRLLEAVAEPIEVAGRILRCTASIGLVDSGSNAELILRDADLAMYRAKGEGGARIVTFVPEMHAEPIKRMELQDDLARALEQGEIRTYFQPKVDLRSARVIGVEALARWVHPGRGVVPPDDFLELAEAGGQMRELTERVIEFSARAAGDWWRSGLGLQLSVNLSASTFSETGWQLDQFVRGVLARTGLPGKAIQFEITEDSLMADPEEAAATLKRLSSIGATISIDDFGTGHSSLGRLKSLPIDELKIDRSFIFDLCEDAGDRTIARSTIHLAHQMGLQVVAEGVETEDVWRQLRSMGCERAQGFLISEPLPAREVPAWLATWNQRARALRSTSLVKRPARSAAGGTATAPA